VKIALSILCENPSRKTGLTTVFTGLVPHSVAQFEDLEWIVFAGPNQEWEPPPHPRVTLNREFPANDHLRARLIADHFRVPARAKSLGAEALVTVGFVPFHKTLPTIMHMLSLQHLDRSNRVGLLRKFYRSFIAERGFAKADAILTNSEFARRQILAAHPECADRLTITGEGLQLESFHTHGAADEAERVRAQFGLAPGFLLWVSNFYPYKQAELLLEGYARLPVETRRELPLVMVGGGWEGGGDSAEARAGALGIRDDVHFLGWIDDAWVPLLYRQARIFTLPSREETFGRCVLEAMACGTPCLVNDIPIMHEVTAGHAVIVDFRDPSAVVAGLQRLLAKGPELEELRAGGLRRAADFSFAKMARARVEVVRQVVLRNKRP
jgi:glycosyltransferase involved in cell wall biosynthesis